MKERRVSEGTMIATRLERKLNEQRLSPLQPGERSEEGKGCRRGRSILSLGWSRAGSGASWREERRRWRKTSWRSENEGKQRRQRCGGREENRVGKRLTRG